MDIMKLKDKVSIVTGAASGMGKAIAELYAKEGAKVIVADLDLAQAEAVSEAINESGGIYKAIEVNVANQEDIDYMNDETVETYGTLDILVNNAGIMDGFEPVGDIVDEKWDLIFDINTKGAMRSEERRVGKECRYRGRPDQGKREQERQRKRTRRNREGRELKRNEARVG